MSLIKEYQKEFKAHGVMSGTTYILLDYLGNGDVAAAQEIIADQNKPKSQKKADNKSKSPDRDDRYADSARSSDDEKPLLSSPIKLIQKTVQSIREKNANVGNANIYIGYLKAELLGEVQRNSFVQFFTNLWGTKHHKLRALEKLQSIIDNDGSFEDLQKEVNKILDENGPYRNADPNKDINPTKVNHSILSSRTKDIFEAIQNKDVGKLKELADIATSATPSIKP